MCLFRPKWGIFLTISGNLKSKISSMWLNLRFKFIFLYIFVQFHVFDENNSFPSILRYFGGSNFLPHNLCFCRFRTNTLQYTSGAMNCPISFWSSILFSAGYNLFHTRLKTEYPSRVIPSFLLRLTILTEMIYFFNRWRKCYKPSEKLRRAVRSLL